MKFPTKPVVPPPVYRPQPLPKVLQTKMAIAQPVREARKVPTAPPVYRPQQSRIQPKTTGPVRPHAPVKPHLPVAPAPGVKRPAGPPAFSPPGKPQCSAAQTPGPPNTNGSRTIQRRSSNTIQREVVFSSGSRRNQVNVAESVGRMVDFAITRAQLNGVWYPGRSRAVFVAALLPPTLQVQQGVGSVAVSVKSVPVQRVSFAMELPTRDGWELDVQAQNIKVKLENQDKAANVVIPIDDNENATLKLKVKGLPSDGTFADMVRTHEDVHARDIQRAVDAVLRPWDDRLNRMRRLGTRFVAPNEMNATARLYQAAGGTPAVIGGRFADMLQQLGDAFHQTAAGRGPVIVGIARTGSRNRTLEVSISHTVALSGLHRQRLAEENERARLEELITASLRRRPIQGPINEGGEGNAAITNDML